MKEIFGRDFNITKWISNLPKVRQAFGAEETKVPTVVSGKEESLKVLEVVWKKRKTCSPSESRTLREKYILEGCSSETRKARD